MQPTDIEDQTATDEAVEPGVDSVPAEEELLVEELLVEEISIDGMCGVY